jgi:hypothetical protein
MRKAVAMAVCFLSLFLASAVGSAVTHAPPKQGPRADGYGRISWRDEKARLDNFALMIENWPGAVGYVSVINGAEFCPGEARARAVRATKYLVSKRQVPASRVKWKIWGYTKEFLVTLEIMGPGQGLYDPFDRRIPEKEARIRPDCKKIMSEIKKSKF